MASNILVRGMITPLLLGLWHEEEHDGGRRVVEKNYTAQSIPEAKGERGARDEIHSHQACPSPTVYFW